MLGLIWGLECHRARKAHKAEGVDRPVGLMGDDNGGDEDDDGDNEDED